MTKLINSILASGDPLSHVVQHELFRLEVGGYELMVSNHLVMVLVSAVLLVIILPLAARQRTIVPTGLRNFFEAICVFIREEIARPALGENTDKFIGYLWTTFFFILFCNLLGMVPTDGILYLVSFGRLRHLGGAATANIWITGALAASAFFMIHVLGIRQQGLFSYVKNFIPHVPWPLMPVMYVLEIIGALVKPFALAIRLFANILAGHIVLGTLMGLALVSKSLGVAGVTLVGCAALSLLELFVAFLQAYIFTFLVTLFIGAAVHPEH